MLGQFLELSVTAPAVEASYNFYQGLGFTPLEVGETWEHPYAVVTDGRMTFGLHGYEFQSPSLTFVRPELSNYVAALKRADLSFEFAKLGEDEFNELGFVAPSGLMITLLEARTFFRAPERPGPSLCGQWLELSLSTRSLQDSESFWGRLGFEVERRGDNPHPWTRVMRDDLRIGLHESPQLFVPQLAFGGNDLEGRTAFLELQGIELKSDPNFPGARSIAAPEGTKIVFFEEDDNFAAPLTSTAS